MLKLKEVIKNEVFQRGVKQNLRLTKNEMEKIASEVENSTEINLLSIELKEKKLVVEMTFHKAESKEIYLLEVRAFTDDDKMLGAYLEVFNRDMVIAEENIDDVWDYENWGLVE